MRYFLRTTVDTCTASALWLLGVIHGQQLFHFLFSAAKAFHRLCTNTSEMLRICSNYTNAFNSEAKAGPIFGVAPSLPARSKSRAVEMQLLNSNKDEYLNDSLRHPDARVVFRIEQSLLYSKQLVLERRYFEAIIRNLDHYNSHVDSILEKKLFVASSPEATLLKSCIAIITSTFTLMHQLNERAATPYDRENSSHERKLLELWDLAMPNITLDDRFSKMWELIGFQGRDPATDFRGMGLLGLDDLVYYAKNHSISFQRVLQSSKHNSAWFSMAIVGINITGFTIALLRKRGLQKFFYKYGVSKDIYHEFYCYVFDSFEKKWTAGNSFLTVMDFAPVFHEFQIEIENQTVLAFEADSVLVLDEGRAVLTYNR